MKDKKIAILLAIFLSVFTYVYTYEEDKWKFWFGLVFSILGAPLIFPGFLIWISAIIIACQRDNKWYAEYERRYGKKNNRN